MEISEYIKHLLTAMRRIQAPRGASPLNCLQVLQHLYKGVLEQIVSYGPARESAAG